MCGARSLLIIIAARGVKRTAYTTAAHTTIGDVDCFTWNMRSHGTLAVCSPRAHVAGSCGEVRLVCAGVRLAYTTDARFATALPTAHRRLEAYRAQNMQICRAHHRYIET